MGCLMIEDFSNHLDNEECLVHKVLDQMPIGIFLVGADESVCFMNKVARIIIARNDGLSLDNGRLQAGQTIEMERLSQYLIQAIHDPNCCCPDDGDGAMFFSRDNNILVYHVLIRPLQFTDSVLSATCEYTEPIAIVFVSNPEQINELTSKTIAQLYGLSPAEARVLIELSNGFDRAQIAERLNIGIDAVHAHLHKIFNKTGTHRQTELINLIRTSPLEYWQPLTDSYEI